MRFVMMTRCLFVIFLFGFSLGQEPCIGKGAGCRMAVDNCCEGLQCNPSDYKCEKPQPCKTLGHHCSGRDDCCTGLYCDQGAEAWTCKSVTPTDSPCQPLSKPCIYTRDCCQGLVCAGHKCEDGHPTTTSPTTTSKTSSTTSRACLGKGVKCSPIESDLPCCGRLSCKDNEIAGWMCSH